MFEISKLIFRYENIYTLLKKFRVNDLEELDENLLKIKKYFYNESKNFLSSISLYLQNSSQLLKDIIILKYIPYDFRIIKDISIIHEYIIAKKEINYDSVINFKVPTKIGIREEYIKLFKNIYKPKYKKPFTTTISSNDFIQITNNLLNEYFDKVELTPKEINLNLKLGDIQLRPIETNQELEIYLYNFYQNMKYNIRERDVNISVWEFLKK